jgi:putative SOS response-associated peptidase YedK
VIPRNYRADFPVLRRVVPMGNGRRAYAFLTTDPNPVVGPFHRRAMPVMVQPDHLERWLDDEVERACPLVQRFPSQIMQMVLRSRIFRTRCGHLPRSL